MIRQHLAVSMLTTMGCVYVDADQQFAYGDLPSIRSINGVRRAVAYGNTISLDFDKGPDFNKPLAKSLEKILELLDATVTDVGIRLGDDDSRNSENEQRLRDILALMTPLNP